MGLDRMVKLGLPLIMWVDNEGEADRSRAHDISRTIYRFRRMGYLETVGPAVSYSRWLRSG